MNAIIPLSLGKKWLDALYKQLSKIRKKKKSDLEKINDLLIGVDPLELLKFYVDPESQEINPANSPVEDFNVSRQSTFEKLNEFFDYRNLTNPGNNVLFILSDAGMGKTSLLAMLKLINLTSFWPSEFTCELLKLGKNTLSDVANIEEKRKTILLLDSLDEDSTATGRVHERILEILDATRGFHKVVITCRTQFFPSQDEDRLERPGKIELGGYKCYAKYLSFFDHKKVDEYLGKRFSKKLLIFKIKDKRKITRAKGIIDKMGSLRCRPMLLAHIDEFMKNETRLTDDMDEYEVYDILIDNWLAREEIKSKKSKKELLNACLLLAVNMQQKQLREISREDLRLLVAAFSDIEGLDSIDIEGRSLLNKNSNGDYRFSHYSIQEFLTAKYIREHPGGKLISKIVKTDFLMKMLFKIEWREIPAGTFRMGSGKDHNATVHTVTLDSFFMSKTTVTFSQYDLFCEATGRDKPDDRSWGRGNRPVINVSWHDANDFCKWLSAETGEDVRLPTEAQWEYACRAGTAGDRYGKLDDIAWYKNNSNGKTQPVAQKKANAYGLYDMLGNVWEWCNDFYGEYPENAIENPTGPDSGEGRVLRGGSWVDDGGGVRSAIRYWGVPSDRGDVTGFRFAQVKRSLPARQAGGRSAGNE
jgi:formylglycine-generating enzyme required for sulfatase activity